MAKSEAEIKNVPDCWSDDVRMDVLFAPFRLRKVNPENYEAKLKFWKDMIVRYCDEKGDPSFSIRAVKWAFQRKGKLPHGIENVVEDLLATKKLRLHTDFVNDPQDSWSGWITNSFVRKPLQWSLRKVQMVTDEQDVHYIHLDVLKTQSKNLRKVLEQFAGSVVSFDKIAETKDVALSKSGLFLNLIYLQSLEKVCLEFKFIEGEKRIHLVKVPEKGTGIEHITQVDRTIFALEQTEADLLKTLEEIESEVVKCDKLARENVKQSKRVIAKSYLRKKHKLEGNLDKHSKALDNIHTLLARISETKGNESILDAYSIGSKTLKSLLTTTNLNVDNVDEVVDTIKESLEIHDEIEQSLGTNVQPVDRLEEEALEKELQEILLDDTPVSNTQDSRPQKVETKPGPALPSTTTQGGIIIHPAQPMSDEELLRHLDSLQLDLGSLSTDNIAENNLGGSILSSSNRSRFNGR